MVNHQPRTILLRKFTAVAHLTSVLAAIPTMEVPSVGPAGRLPMTDLDDLDVSGLLVGRRVTLAACSWVMARDGRPGWPSGRSASSATFRPTRSCFCARREVVPVAARVRRWHSRRVAPGGPRQHLVGARRSATCPASGPSTSSSCPAIGISIRPAVAACGMRPKVGFSEAMPQHWVGQRIRSPRLSGDPRSSPELSALVSWDRCVPSPVRSMS